MADTCRGKNGKPGCGAPVQWVVTQKTGKSMPIDPAPAPDGNLVIVERHPNGTAVVAFVTKATPFDDDRPRYKSHFATCPNADTFRV